MIKKLTLLAVSAAALIAFAVPATAQANPVVTNGFGEASTALTAVSTNTKSTTTAGTLECQTVDLTIHLTTNNTTHAQGHGTGTAKGNPNKPEPEKHNGHCTSNTGATVNITSVTVSSITLDGPNKGTGTAAFSYTFDLAGMFHCSLSGTANVTFTPTGNDMIKIGGTLSNPGAAFPCPKEGTIHGDFTVTDEQTGEPVVFH